MAQEESGPCSHSASVIPIMVLTKTTALVLSPSILWLLWKKNLRAIPTASVMAAVRQSVLPVYRLKIQITAVDFHYFFDINARADAGIREHRFFSAPQTYFQHVLGD